MGRSKETFGKKEKEKKRKKKREDKLVKKEERKSNATGGDLESMLAYVDENGNITDTPPDPSMRIKVDIETIEISVPKKEEEDLTVERTGRVEFFNDQKGFGFIQELETKEKYFVHVNGLLAPIKENDLVTFELETSFKGLNAVKVIKK